MKTSSSLWVLLTFASLWGPVPLLAAEKPLEAPATTADVKPAPYDLQIVNGKLLRPNGPVEPTLANVIDVLREQYTEANIILAPGLSKLMVGDLKLRAGKLNEELEAVRVASDDRFELQTPGQSIPRIDPNTGLPTAGTGGINTGLFVLREAPLGPQGRRIVEAFNVGPYLEFLRNKTQEEGHPVLEEGQSLEEIEKIINETIKAFREQSSDADQPSFQYHPGATLLIVIGKVDSVETARKIVNALPGMDGGPHAVTIRTEQQRAADAAFRARYGLMPHSSSAGQPANAPPDSASKH